VRFAQALIRSRLIDEYWLVIHPIALGSGKQLFSDLTEPLRFNPVNQTTFRSGVIAMELQTT
jgi:dihydrofolate reductase